MTGSSSVHVVERFPGGAPFGHRGRKAAIPLKEAAVKGLVTNMLTMLVEAAVTMYVGRLIAQRLATDLSYILYALDMSMR